MPTPVEKLNLALEKHAGDFGIQLDHRAAIGLADYYLLLLHWNERLHLVAPCPEEEFATRHLLESLLLLRHLKTEARVIDVGSGAGLPAIPCLIARTDLSATLIESSEKKSVFLREVLRTLNLSGRAQVIAARFEDMPALEADYVTSRALDRFKNQLPQLIEWAPPQSTLLLFTGEDLLEEVGAFMPKVEIEHIPHSERRFLVVAGR